MSILVVWPHTVVTRTLVAHARPLFTFSCRFVCATVLHVVTWCARSLAVLQFVCRFAVCLPFVCLPFCGVLLAFWCRLCRFVACCSRYLDICVCLFFVVFVTCCLSGYWRAPDGGQPHLINIQFHKKMTVVEMAFYLDFTLDEAS